MQSQVVAPEGMYVQTVLAAWPAQVPLHTQVMVVSMQVSERHVTGVLDELLEEVDVDAAPPVPSTITLAPHAAAPKIEMAASAGGMSSLVTPAMMPRNDDRVR